MKNNRSQNLSKVINTNISDLFWRWIKGVWSSFSRFVRRQNSFLWKFLNPHQGRRASSQINHKSTNPIHISPLVGISQFGNAEFLTVGDLMSKVQWQVPISPTAKSVSVDSVKDEINWD
jgi:hypothetical protein